MQRVHIIVHGTVQGVFFRAKTRNLALNLDLKGYAKNMPDRTVEVVAEGPKNKIKELIRFCKKGPEPAEVHKIDIKFDGRLENTLGKYRPKKYHYSYYYNDKNIELVKNYFKKEIELHGYTFEEIENQ